MKIKKTMTERKQAANRENAKRSTGPRTEKGIANSRLNATVHGFFTDEVIPRVDGCSQSDHDALRARLHAQFQPVGDLEEACVEEMASGLLARKRVRRWETALIRQAASIDNAPRDEDKKLEPAREDLRTLKTAQQEIEVQGTVSPLIYEKVVLILSKHHEWKRGGETGQTHLTSVPVERAFVDGLNKAMKRTEDLIATLLRQDEEKVRDFYLSTGVLPEAKMTQVIQAERRATGRLERALRNLQDLQEQRRNGEGASLSDEETDSKRRTILM
jgi:hypothetical protein